MTAAFENQDLASLQDFMDKHLSVSQNSINPTIGRIFDWFMDVVKEAIKNSDLKNIKKEDFLKLVASMYDKFVLPIDLPGPDVVLDPLLKQIVLNQAERLYDKFFVQQNPVPVLGSEADTDAIDL
jgi:hypothetical protein